MEETFVRLMLGNHLDLPSTLITGIFSPVIVNKKLNMDINEWKDVQGLVCEQPTIIITEIVDLVVDLYTNVTHYV